MIAPLGGAGPTTVSFGVTVEGPTSPALGVAGAGLLLLVLAVELLRPRGPDAPVPRGAGCPSPTTRRSRPVRRPGARKAARRRRRTRTTAATLAAVLLASGCQLPQPSTEEAASLARTKVSLTEDDLPALYASYDARRARAVRRPAHRRTARARGGPPTAGWRWPWTATRPRPDGSCGLGHGHVAAAHRAAGLRRAVRRLPDVGARGGTRRAAATPRCT